MKYWHFGGRDEKLGSTGKVTEAVKDAMAKAEKVTSDAVSGKA